MYAYCLLVHTPGSSKAGEWESVRPGPDMEISTLAELKLQVQHDLGFVPDWLEGCPAEEYIGVQEEYEVRGTWFCLDIEGSQDHTLPPLAERIAWDRAAREGTLEQHFPRKEVVE